MSLRTPLARVKGTGPAGEGTGHFWHQRLTAIALIPCVVWFCFSLASLPALVCLLIFAKVLHRMVRAASTVEVISAGSLFLGAAWGNAITILAAHDCFLGACV